VCEKERERECVCLCVYVFMCLCVYMFMCVCMCVRCASAAHLRPPAHAPVTMADVAVIAPYRKQVLKLRHLFRSAGLGAVRIGSIDDFQGQEETIVIISTVISRRRSHPSSSDLRPSQAMVRVFCFQTFLQPQTYQLLLSCFYRQHGLTQLIRLSTHSIFRRAASGPLYLSSS
jgi:hypothetical protein